MPLLSLLETYTRFSLEPNKHLPPFHLPPTPITISKIHMPVLPFPWQPCSLLLKIWSSNYYLNSVSTESG